MSVNHTEMRDLAPQTANGVDSVVEIGANSLKFHSSHSGYIHTVKYAYDLGHDVYGTGRMSERTIQSIVEMIRAHGIPAFAIGTSAVRDAENSGTLYLRMREELGLELHVLSCFEESSLLAKAYLSHSKKLPALVLDIGGGSVEIVFLTHTRSFLWESLPIGAIRLYHRWKADGLSSMSDSLDRHLRCSSIVMKNEVFATGGTVKAMAGILGKTTWSRRDVVDLERQVHRDRLSCGVSPQRSRVLLPGVILIRKLLEFVQADSLHYIGISVGRQALEERLATITPIVRSHYFRPSAVQGHST